MLRGSFVTTLLAKIKQLTLKQPKLLDTGRNVSDVPIKQSVHVSTSCTRLIPKTQQHPDLFKRHIQAAAVPNQLKAVQVGRFVDPEVSGGSCRRRQ